MRTNVLGNSVGPLFFRVGNAADLGLVPAVPRLDESIRTHVRSLSVMQKEALLVSGRTGAAWRLASDEGAYLDGDDEAPCPLSFLTTGMVSSYMHEILALANQRDIDIANIRLIQDNFYTMKGSALKGTMTGGARDVELEAQIESNADRETIARLVSDGTAASPLNGLMRHRRESLFSLTHNGRGVACGRVAAATSDSAPALPNQAFDSATPEPGDWSGLIARNGMTPRTEEATSFAGSSLAEHQDRILHVRAICTLRPDGVKEIEQHLYNPHGSIFHFLSDEAPRNGGQGLAPDAATYISAGIAFCFMTQLGRYAKIAGKTLEDYRIVQDTHFSLGGASGGTGEAGAAAPVETHVHLATAEDDEFAQTALDMSEQTCFLHALCRTELRTRVRIRDFDQSAS
jgi:organic hydroperoxide reductase OsmC/OhrA